ncbi:MAG: FecR domain-containing protein [Defluviitaleaceae bacterium]|nr:FecR domain-containing protein [Defluviitaleaceae bacterium]
MKRIFSLLLSALLIITFCNVAVFAETARTVVVESVQGTITMTRGTNREFNVNAGIGLRAGNTLITGRNSSAVLLLDGESTVTVAAFTKIDISRATSTDLKLTVISGAISVNAAPQPPSHNTSVSAGNSTMGIRGTLFTTVFRNGDLTVTLLEGELEMEGDAFGDGLTMAPGFVLEVSSQPGIRVDADGVNPLDLAVACSFTLETIREHSDMLIELGVLTVTDVANIDQMIDEKKTEEAAREADTLANPPIGGGEGDDGAGTVGSGGNGSDNEQLTVLAGAAITTPAAIDIVSHNALTVTAAQMASNPGRQLIEYAIATQNDIAPRTGWQTGRLFTGLAPETMYFVWARSQANASRRAGTAVVSAEGAMTTAPPASVPTLITAAALTGLVAPVTGISPAAITNSDQFTGAVEWDPPVLFGGTFAASTSYSAIITLTAATGYTFAGGFANDNDISGFNVVGATELPTFISNIGLTLVFSVPFPQTESGLGTTEDNPIIISSAALLALLAEEVNGGQSKTDVFYALDRDIDLSDLPLVNWTPIGTFTGVMLFNGIFDGRGHTISNLTLEDSGSQEQGLFGAIGVSGTVRNLNLDNVTISGAGISTLVGGLAAQNFGTIHNSTVSGSAIAGTDNVGGLVGRNSGTITSSSAIGTVEGRNDVGGLVGSNNYTVENSHAESTVTGIERVGGLVGWNADTRVITSSSATGTVEGNTEVGGLVGQNGGDITDSRTIDIMVSGSGLAGGLVGNNIHVGTVTNSSAEGTVEGGASVGGLVGDNTGTITSGSAIATVRGETNVGGLVGDNAAVTVNTETRRGMIENSFAEVMTWGEVNVGGLAGKNDGAITSSYATGTVNGDSNVGGLVGSNSGTITNTYAAGQVNGDSNVGGLAGENLGDIENSVALNRIGAYDPAPPLPSPPPGGFGRIAGTGTGSFVNNYADDMTINGVPVPPADTGPDTRHGETNTSLSTQTSWVSALPTWDFAVIWEWDYVEHRPILRSVRHKKLIRKRRKA